VRLRIAAQNLEGRDERRHRSGDRRLSGGDSIVIVETPLAASTEITS